MTITFHSEWEYGTILYLKHDKDQESRMLTAHKIDKSQCILYELSSGTVTSLHYDFEISEEKIL